jgi:hypothetical protein
MGNEFSVITRRLKKKIIEEDGTKLDFWSALGDNRDKLRDEDVVNIINDDAARGRSQMD